MAGDWIKMRTDLATDPCVVALVSRICRASVAQVSHVCVHQCHAVGALHHLWSLADRHTRDGFLANYTPELIDSVVGIPGFCETLAEQGWLEIGPSGVRISNFDRHNGESAKKRMLNTKRQNELRERNASVAQVSRNESDNCATREEKRREEKSKEQNPPNPPRGAGGKKAKRSVSDEDVTFAVTQSRVPDPVANSMREFVVYRREKNKPVSPMAFGKMIDRWREIGDESTIAGIQRAIANDWQGAHLDSTQPHKMPQTGSNGQEKYDADWITRNMHKTGRAG